MKYVLALVSLLAIVGFVGSAQAKEGKPKVHKGHFIKFDEKTLTYKGGVKGTGKEHTVKIDDSTKVTLDGKDAKLADLKPDIYIEISETDGVVTTVAAMTVTPEPTTKPTTRPSTTEKTEKTDK